MCAHEIGEDVAVGVDDLHHPIFCNIELPDDQPCIDLVPTPLISVRAGVDDLLPLAVRDAVVRFASLPQPVRVLLATVCRALSDQSPVLKSPK